MPSERAAYGPKPASLIDTILQISPRAGHGVGDDVGTRRPPRQHVSSSARRGRM